MIVKKIKILHWTSNAFLNSDFKEKKKEKLILQTRHIQTFAVSENRLFIGN